MLAGIQKFGNLDCNSIGFDLAGCSADTANNDKIQKKKKNRSGATFIEVSISYQTLTNRV